MSLLIFIENALDFSHFLKDVYGDADKFPLFLYRCLNLLNNPPGCVGGYFISSFWLIFFNCFDKSDIAFADEVCERHAGGEHAEHTFESLCYVDDKFEVCMDHFIP